MLFRPPTVAAFIFVAFVSTVLAPPATAQQSGAGFRVELSQSAQVNRQMLQSNQSGLDFIMRPSVTSSTLGAGVQTLPLTVFCVDFSTGQILNNCNVNITHQAQASTGGHDHDDAARPKGSFKPSSGNTGTSGLPTTYTSPETSGVIEVTLTGTATGWDAALSGDLLDWSSD